MCKTRPAFFLRRYSGEMLCKSCFITNFEKRVYKTIKKYQLIARGDNILVAVSGGKDSLVLLHLMAKLKKKLELRLTAVTIDEGVEGYRSRGIELAREEAKKVGVEHKVVSFKEEYGLSLDQIVERAKKRGLELHPCSYCGILRRRLINKVALEIGATKVATAHNLDDEAQTVLINLIRGDLLKVVRLGVKPPLSHEKFIPRIKPLRYTPENEIAVYAMLKGIDLYEVECPYIRLAMRDEIRNFLNNLEEKHPGTKHSILSSADKLARELKEVLIPKITIKTCKKCGMPSTREICRTCEIFEQLGISYPV